MDDRNERQRRIADNVPSRADRAARHDMRERVRQARERDDQAELDEMIGTPRVAANTIRGKR